MFAALKDQPQTPAVPTRDNAKRALQSSADTARAQAKIYQYLIETLPDDMPEEVNQWVWNKVLSDRH